MRRRKPACQTIPLKWEPILEELNDYRLKVIELKPEKDEIRLDGEKVADCTAAALAEGVNLASAALQHGPLAAQVGRVIGAAGEKNRYFQEQVFRTVLLATVSLPDFLEKREAILARIEKKRVEVSSASSGLPGTGPGGRRSISRVRGGGSVPGFPTSKRSGIVPVHLVGAAVGGRDFFEHERLEEPPQQRIAAQIRRECRPLRRELLLHATAEQPQRPQGTLVLAGSLVSPFRGS